MDNRHEFNVYLSADHQFNVNLVLTRSFNSYLDNIENLSIVIDNFHSDSTLFANFIQSLSIMINSISLGVRTSASFVGISRMEINEDYLSVSLVPSVNFNINENMNARVSSSEKILNAGFANTQKFEEQLKELLRITETISLTNNLKMETTAPIAAHYFLLSNWDSYSGSDLDIKTISEMEYEIV